MPARKGSAPRGHGQASSSIRFINTTGQPTLGIALCARCQTKRMLGDLIEDGNIQKFYVCADRQGCRDEFDPFRLPTRAPDDYRLPFIRPDGELTVPPEDEAQLPLSPLRPG